MRRKEEGTAPHWYHRSNFREKATQLSVCAGIWPRGCKPAFWPQSSSNFFHTGQNNKAYNFNVLVRTEYLLLPRACNQREDVGYKVNWMAESLLTKSIAAYLKLRGLQQVLTTYWLHSAWTIRRHHRLWSRGYRPFCNLKCNCQTSLSLHLLKERASCLDIQETDQRVFSSCYLYAFVWKCSHLLYWTWQKGSPSPLLLLSSSGRTSLHLFLLGWWKASTSKVGLSWTPVLLWLFDILELYHLVAVEVHPCGEEKHWLTRSKKQPRTKPKQFQTKWDLSPQCLGWENLS